VFGSNEDITVMKISTHGGQDALVYFMQKNPSFFEIDKKIYPTGLSGFYLFAVASTCQSVQTNLAKGGIAVWRM